MLRRKNAVLKHHDQSPSVQQRCITHTKILVKAFEGAGNHFDENSDEVAIIETRDGMTDNVSRIITSAHGEGHNQCADIVVHRIHSTAVQQSLNKIHLPDNRHKNRNKSKYVNTTNKDMHSLGQL